MPRSLCPTLSLLVTYRCNIACRHCGPFCGPNQTDTMQFVEMKSLIRQAADLGAGNVVFTGGEPTLLGDDLPRLLRFIRDETAITSTRLVTNGAWASSPAQARRRLAQWQAAGLDEVNISCGEYHQEFVPLQQVVNAYQAACMLDFSTVLLAGEFLAPGQGRWEPEDFRRATGIDLPAPEEASPFCRQVRGMSCGAAMNYGRGAAHIRREQMATQPLAEIPSQCTDVLTAITAHPDGQLTACCGVMVREPSLLTLGNWRRASLQELLETAGSDLILNWIRYLGLRDMHAWLLRQDPSLPLRQSYATICDLCAGMLYEPRCRDLLLRHGPERHDDIVANRLTLQAGAEAGDRFVYAEIPAEATS